MLIGRVLTALGLVVLLMSGLPASAMDNELSRKTLKGLTGVNVLVEDLTEDNKRAGFNERTFQTDVELKLRMAGIKVLSEEESFSTTPYLNVEVSGLHTEPNEYTAFSIHIVLHQKALLARDPSLRSYGASWSMHKVGEGDLPFIRAQRVR